MFFFHFFHIVNFNFFKKNLGYLSFHLRQFFLVIAFVYCVCILDIFFQDRTFTYGVCLFPTNHSYLG